MGSVRAPGGLYGGTSGSGIYGGLRTGGLARGAGGGGGALGGSVFVRGDTAASLVWVNSSASAGLLTPGAGAAVTFAVPSDGGSTAGSSLFLSSGPTTLEVPTGTNFIAGSIAGWGPDTTSVVKTGPGRLVLSGTNSYTGTTTVSDGTLEIDGDNSASTRLIVRAGGMLAGDGIVGPLTVNAGGVLFPGHGLGTLTVGNTVWNGPGTHILRLYDATGARGEGYNSLTVNGTLDLSSSSNLTVKISSQSDPDGTPGDALHFDNATRASWVLARATGGVRNFNPTGFTVVLAADETSSGFSNVIGAGTFVVGVSGNDLVLNFEPPRAPVAVALDVSNLSTNSATFNGTVNNFGFASSAWFEYGTTTNYGSVTAVVNVPGALGIPVSAAVAGLFPNTVYHYRLVASNSVASPSQDLTFMTRGLPEATTLAAGPVLSATAVLNGQVVSHGLPTVYYYRYGLTTNYGSVTPSGDATLSERALGFGGADSVQVPTPAVPSGNSQYTIEAWINPDAMGALGIIGWGNFGNTRQATALRLTDTGLDHYWWDMDLLSQTTNLTGSWHHVAASFDGTTRITYLDGVAVGSDQPNSDHFVPSANLALGVTGFGEWFRGRIGETRVWSVAVDQAALQAWMIRPVGSGHPYYESLQARWPMTEGTGTYIADVTGHGNTGTLTGSGYWTNGPVFFNDLSAIQVSSGISGLLAATEYHFQLVASNALGVVYGSDVAFATPILAPSLAGVTAVSITSSNAVLQANPSPNGASTTFYFRHGLATNYTSASSPVILPDLNGVQPRSLVLENLAPGTVYHFQAVASNNVGITASKDMVFTTVPVAPSAITGTAIPLGPTTASLNGSTGTGGGATAVYFEYGPTVAYGSSVSTLISATPAIQTVSVTVAGLNPGGSYHFRTVVSNATATVAGGDVAFTMPLPPVAETLAATQVTGASATLNAQVDPAGADTTVYFIYGAPPSYGLISYAAQVSAKGGVQTVSVPVGGLATLSAYQVRVIASSVAGEVLGNETHFTTLASELSATTRQPYGVVSNSAAALGSITPGSEPFCWWYEYGINTNYGSATIPRCGQTRAGALHFGGADSVADAVPSVPAGSAPYTIEAWIDPDTMGTLGILGWGNFGQIRQATALRLTDSGLNHYWWAADLLSTTEDLEANWHHVAATFDGTNRITYLDGLVVGSDQPGTNHTTPSANLALGVTGLGEYFRGNVAEARVWSVAVSQATLQNWRFQGVSGTHPDYAHLALYWPMYEGGGTTLNDASGNGNIGTFAGTPVWTNGPSLTNMAVSAVLSGLTGGQSYHFQLVVSNSSGISRGGDVTFSTPVTAPSILSASADTVTSSNAVLHADPVPNGAATMFYFQYGQSTSYGMATTPVALPQLIGTQPQMTAIGGLLPGTLYHFRAVASNSIGSTFGGDLTFVTDPIAPSAMTTAAVSQSPETALLQASVDTGGAVTTVYFQYGPTDAYGSVVSTDAGAVPGVGTISALATGLAAGETYHFRAIASNSVGTVSGGDIVFTMPVVPAASTLGAISITAFGATLQGQVDPGGGDATVYFRYGSGTNYGLTSAAVLLPAAGGPQPLSIPVSGLVPASTYHFQLVCSNTTGVAFGEDLTFSTLSSAPYALTLPASGIAPGGAVANGAANPNNLPSTAWFVYGGDTNYGNATVPQPVSPGTISVQFDGSSSVTVVSPRVPAGSSPYTIEAWIHPDSMGAEGIVGWGNFGQNRQATALRLYEGGLDHYWWDVDLLATTPDLSGVWHHVAATFDGTNRMTYLDGISVGSDQPGTDHFTPSANLALGVTGFGEWFHGRIAEARVWSTAIDPFTLQDWRFRTLNPDHPDYDSLAAYWPMDEGTGTSIADLSGNRNTGAFSGSPVWASGPPVTNRFVSAVLAGFSPATTYHYRLVVSNASGISLGQDVSFFTATTAAVTNLAANPVSAFGATLNAAVNPANADTAVYFLYGLTTNYGSLSATVNLGASLETGPVSIPASGLLPGSDYHYTVVASNAAGIARGSDLVFTTLASAPVVGSPVDMDLGPSQATLGASVNPSGAATAIYILYGLSTNYGAVLSTNLPAGSYARDVRLLAEGLQAASTYYYQVIASNSAGVVQGLASHFVTPYLNEPSSPWTLVPLLSYNSSRYNGKFPRSGLLQSPDGLFYGSTFAARTGNGTFFRWNTNGAYTERVMATNNGNGLLGSLARGSDGRLYAAAPGGNAGGKGAVIAGDASLATAGYIYRFAPGGASSPQGGVMMAGDGNLYGTTFSGGSGFGTVWGLSGSSLIMLYAFDGGTDGANPQSTLVQGADGLLYGTASAGGTNGTGTIFAITLDGSLTPLYSFGTTNLDGSNSDGASPVAGLVQARDGVLYGTTTRGGASGNGTVFAISTNGLFTTLHSFGATNAQGANLDGALPLASMIVGADGKLYGTTFSGGIYGQGAVFQITTGGVFTLVYSLWSEVGINPMGALLEASDGNLYGTASAGGTNGLGALFKIINPNPPPVFTSRLSDALVSVGKPFSVNAPLSGVGPFSYQWQFNGTNLPTQTNAALALAAASLGDAGSYRVIVTNPNATVTSSTFTLTVTVPPVAIIGSPSRSTTAGDSVTFPVTYSGAYYASSSLSLADIILNASGTASAVTSLSGGGTSYTVTLSQFGGKGTLSISIRAGTAVDTGGGLAAAAGPGPSVSVGTWTYVPLHAFDPATEGSNPKGGLLLGQDGNFYGTTSAGGIRGSGTIYRVTPTGLLTVVHSFSATNEAGANFDGANPLADLIQGPDGTIYGNCPKGGTNGTGSVFALTPGGQFTTLFAFEPLQGAGTNRYGARPMAGLTLGRDGRLYGTAYAGGPGGKGGLFGLTTQGALVFSSCPSSSQFGYYQGSVWDNYQNGLLAAGSSRAVPSGFNGFSVTLTANPSISDARILTWPRSFPSGRLLALPDGGVVGTTPGAFSDYGSIFICSSFALVPAFNKSFSGGLDGAFPQDGVVQGLDGYFYGTASAGGAYGYGTVFAANSAGSLFPIYAFSAPDGVTGTNTDGATPWGHPAFDRSGHLYGTTTAGGTNGAGMIFMLANAHPWPVANTDILHRQAGRSLKIPLASLLANDTGAADAVLSTSSIATNSTGGIPLNRVGNTLVYLPPAANRSDDSFTYTVTDGVFSVTGTVIIVVDNPPDAVTQNITGTAIVSGGALQITAAGIPGRSYQLQQSASLVAPISWYNLGGPQTAAANGQMQFTDPAPATPRFYRVIEP